MKCMTPPVAHYMASFKMKIQCQRGKRAVTVKEVALLPTMTKLVASWLLDGMMWEVIDVDGMKAMILQGARTMEGIRHLTAPQHGMHAVTVKEAALGMETLVQQVPQKNPTTPDPAKPPTKPPTPNTTIPGEGNPSPGDSGMGRKLAVSTVTGLVSIMLALSFAA